MSEKPSSQHVKVLLDIERDDGKHEVESVWAVPEGHGYQLDNIPFYARGFANGDVVSATPDPDGMLRCTGLVRASGHSTIRLWFADAKDVQKVRDVLRALQCDSELDNPRLVAVDVPPHVNYEDVLAYLKEAEQMGIFEYEEGCIGTTADQVDQ